MADNGSNDNLMPPHVLRAIISARPNTLVVDFDTPIEFKMAANSMPGLEEYTVVCQQSVRASVRLNKVTFLSLRNFTCIVSSIPYDTVLLGKPVLEALGLNVY